MVSPVRTVVALLIACHVPPVHHAPTAYECQLAEANIVKLQCTDEDGNPLWVTPKGTRWSVVCLEDNVDFHALDVAKVKRCADMESAFHGDMQ